MAGIGAGVVVETAGRILTLGLNAAVKPHEVMGAQKAFYDYSVIIPEPGALMDAYQQRLLTEHAYRYFMGRHGVQALPLEESDPESGRDAVMDLNSIAWRAVERSSRSMPDIMLALKADLSGLLGKGTREALFDRYKLDLQWWQKCWPMLYEAPGIGEANDLHIRGIIDDATWRKMLYRQGALPEEWVTALQGRLLIPTPEELQLMRNRGMIDDADFNRFMERAGWGTELWRRSYLELRKVIPPVSDLLHFDQKDVFVGPLASALHLYDEFPENAVPWAARQGLTGGPAFPITVDGQQVPADWLHLYWGARWDAPAFGQIAEFYQRFGAHRKRPRIPEGLDVLRLSVGPGPGGIPGVPGGAVGRGAAAGHDVRTWLRYANIPPVIRDTFLAAAFRPLGMRQVSQAVRLGTIKRADAVESYQDQGYSPDDAERMADLAVEQDRYAKDAPRRSLVQRLIGESVREIVASYETGVISRALAAEKLLQVLQDRNAVDGQLGIVDNRILRGLADRALRSIRTDWMQGTLSPAELEAALLSAGIQPERVTYYVQLWTLERGHRRRAASSGQILSWVAKGLMPAEEASRRLANLGWYGPDAAVLLAESQHKLAKLQAAEEARVASTASKSAKAVAKMQKDTEALQKSLQSRLRASEPVSRLMKWIKAGIIDEPQFRKRLQAIGVVPSVIEQYVREVHAEMGTERAKAEEAATTKSRKGVRHAPVSTLRKWLKLGIINEDQFRSMAAAVKTDKDDIERYVQQTEMGK